ncbi:hypothetical protein ACFQES_09625 [Nonomuraea salmonea]|uniref:hypothetical protein n=1 Tax=Nonomuraea salmonea TaxID=46181 RepID=UPI0036133992
MALQYALTSDHVIVAVLGSGAGALVVRLAAGDLVGLGVGLGVRVAGLRVAAVADGVGVRSAGVGGAVDVGRRRDAVGVAVFGREVALARSFAFRGGGSVDVGVGSGVLSVSVGTGCGPPPQAGRRRATECASRSRPPRSAPPLRPAPPP